jgi:hypothetical protein
MMVGFDQLLIELMRSLPTSAGDEDSQIAVTDLDLEVPLEARIESRGTLKATLPRGRMSTGFDVPLARLRVRAEAKA